MVTQLLTLLSNCRPFRFHSLSLAHLVMFNFFLPLHHPLKLHVKNWRVQDDATVWIVSVLLKRQRQCSLLVWFLQGFGAPLLLFLRQTYRQRVAVDVIDPGVVLRCLRFPEEGQRVDEAGRPLHSFDRHRVQRLASSHCTLIHVGSLWLPGEEVGTDCTKDLKVISHCTWLYLNLLQL